MHCAPNWAVLWLPDNNTLRKAEARSESVAHENQVNFLLTFHLIFKLWVRPRFCRTHCCWRWALMSYIKTKHGTTSLSSSTLLLGTASWHLGTGIRKCEDVEKQNLIFKWKSLQVQCIPSRVMESTKPGRNIWPARGSASVTSGCRAHRSASGLQSLYVVSFWVTCLMWVAMSTHGSEGLFKWSLLVNKSAISVSVLPLWLSSTEGNLGRELKKVRICSLRFFISEGDMKSQMTSSFSHGHLSSLYPQQYWVFLKKALQRPLHEKGPSKRTSPSGQNTQMLKSWNVITFLEKSVTRV